MFYWENPFSVGFVEQLFQPASNQVEKVEAREEALAVFDFAGYRIPKCDVTKKINL